MSNAYKVYFTGNLKDAEELVLATINGTAQFNDEYLGQAFTKPLAIEMIKTFGATLVGEFRLAYLEVLRTGRLGAMETQEHIEGIYDCEGRLK